MGFTSREAFEGVWHIADAMGVCMTLLVGRDRALLIDTGYGLEDVSAYVRTLTDKPLTVVLTHHHHDHVLGARWFDETYMFAEDIDAFPTYTSESRRRRVLVQAREKGVTIPVDKEFSTTPIVPPRPLEEGPIDLGGLTAHIVHCPGHTPGSAVVWVPERDLLLTGDAWNPTTWLFFPEALPVREYLQNLRALLLLSFEHILCSHQQEAYPRVVLEAFLHELTDRKLMRASPIFIPLYGRIDTREVQLFGGQTLVFDWAKAHLRDRGE